jgi:hypothetical protein
MIEQKQLIDIIKNPSKYTKEQESFCKLINVLLVDINRLTNKLTIYQQNLLNNKYGYIQKDCIAQKANDIALFSMFSPNLLSNNEERLINLINRYIHITGLLNYNMPLNNTGGPPGSGYGYGYPGSSSSSGYGYGYPGSSSSSGYGYGYPADNVGENYFSNNVSHSRIYSPTRVDFASAGSSVGVSAGVSAGASAGVSAGVSTGVSAGASTGVSVGVLSNQTGGEFQSKKTIKNFNTKNLEEANLTSQTLSINFVDSENTQKIDGNKFFARGASTAIYKIKIKTNLINL